MERKKHITIGFKKRMVSLIAILCALFLCSSLQKDQLVDPQITNAETINDLKVPQPNAIITDNMSLVNRFDDFDSATNWNLLPKPPIGDILIEDSMLKMIGSGYDSTVYRYNATYQVDLSSTYPINDAWLTIVANGSKSATGTCQLRVFIGNSPSNTTQQAMLYTTTSTPALTDTMSTFSVKLSDIPNTVSKPFYVRIQGSLERTGDTIMIDSISLTSFNSSISFNDSINATENFVANLSLFDPDDLVDKTASRIRLYYNLTGTQVTANSPSIAATGTYPNYQFTLTPDIYTQGNQIIYFAYGMRNSGTNLRNFTSIVYSFSFNDTVIPSINSVVFNATPQYGQSTNITVSLSDTGGARLKEVRLYYRVGSGALSLTEYESRLDYTIPVHTNSYTHNFTIAGSLISVDPTRPFRFFIQVFDKVNNQNISVEYQIQGTDYVAPTVTFVSMQGNQSNYVKYWESFIITYSVTKSWDSLGLNFIQFRWKQGSAPMNNNDFTGNFTVNVYAEKIYTATFDLTNRLGTDFLMDNTYYFWVFVQDISNNTRTTFSENRNFRIQDIFAPEVSENPNNTMNGGYLDDYILEFTLIERNGTLLSSSGINASNVTLEYTINQDFVVPNIQMMPAVREGNLWRYIFLNASLNEGDMLRYRFNASDYAGNYYSTGIRVINITDIYKPIITLQSSLSNITLLRTEYDALIVISAIDELNKPIKNANISIRFGSAGSYESGIEKIPSSWNSSSMFYFLLNKTFLAPYGDQRMFYIIRVVDFAGNYREYSGEQHVVLQVVPIFISASFNGISGINVRSQIARFNFVITSNSLMYLYINGTVQNTEPYVGAGLEQDISFGAEGFWEIKVVYYTETWSRVYYVDWTAPEKPQNVRFSISNKNITLTWSAVPVTQPFDVHRYQIHRSTSQDFVPHVSNMIAVIDGIEYIDSVEEEGVYYYRIVVVDRAGNLSPASDLITVDTINPSGANLGGIILTSFAIVGGVVGFVVILNKKKNSYTSFKEPKAPKAPKVKAKKGKRSDPFAMLEDKRAKSEGVNRDPNKPAISGGTAITGTTTAATASRNALNAKSSAHSQADDGWGTSGSANEGWSSSEPTSPSSKPELTPIQVPEGAELVDGIPCSYRWSDEMKELYKDAKDFLDLENKQSAIESLEILVRKAESRNDEHTRAWAKAEIERIYREH